MNKSWHLPRRTFLKGLGTTMALPLFEAMSPLTSFASAVGTSAAGHPKRMAFVYIPNGANMADWTPRTMGKDFDLPYILEPLKPLQSEIQVLTGLAHDKAKPNGDGAGDHARASATFLTGCQARKTAAVDIKVGVSVDQIAAERVGKFTRLSSLELSCDRGRQTGACDSGYSCAYQFNISWKTESTPMPPEVDPRLVFERLFSNGVYGEVSESRARRERYQKSIIDFVLDDARSLQRKLGATDRRKLDEYLTAIRELEQRIERAERFATAHPDFSKPDGVPQDYGEHIRIMYDLLALAFQTDTTRIGTFIVAHDGSNRSYPLIGVPEGHHDLSHHGNDEAKKQKIAKINRFHMEQFAYFLNKLKSMKEGEGSVLDNCMIVYGGGIGDGNRHNHNDLPVLLAGRGGGTLRPGRHLRFDRDVSMTNLYLSMLDRLNVPAERIGDSTGRLDAI
ncbi:MAG TPA: DUF1552 domain-containing protein [Methylomirabilota bacterium]|nr:DUF1552 domain-containing protein [Methylomirabilota bacterium]